MEDRELLELAAKAAGGIEYDQFKKIFRHLLPMGFLGEEWNPLDDDGDAFRLVASLRLEVIPGKHFGDGCSVNSRRYEIPGVTVFLDRKDMREQIRRAIVLASAEIGKSMP